MDSTDLRIFSAVARFGGMSRAADHLNTVQSNVTARIRLLEDQLGLPLFHRHSRGATLTQAGERLLPYAEQIQHLIDDATKALKDTGRPTGSLTLGSLETTASLRLSHHLADFAATYPDVDLILRTGTTCELVQSVLDRTVEGAFVCGPVDHPALVQTMAFREELALLTAPCIKSPDELHNPKLVVLRSGCSYRERLEALLRRRGIQAVRLLEFGTLDAILACVAAGIGVTLLPHSLVPAGARITIHALPPADAQVETLFIRRRDSFVSTAMNAFIGMTCPAPARAAAE